MICSSHMFYLRIKVTHSDQHILRCSLQFNYIPILNKCCMYLVSHFKHIYKETWIMKFHPRHKNLIRAKREISSFIKRKVRPSKTVADTGGGRVPRTRAGLLPLSPNYFIFMQFSAKILQSNRLARPIGSWCPPLGNFGSATVKFHFSMTTVKYDGNCE